MSGDETFVVTRAAMLRQFRSGRLFGGPSPIDCHRTDPDAFTMHGSDHALDRWADDGGAA